MSACQHVSMSTRRAHMRQRTAWRAARCRATVAVSGAAAAPHAGVPAMARLLAALRAAYAGLAADAQHAYAYAERARRA